ncbi:uncharacterized protein LOC118647872 [Monomorium pharaonis]|uniref:uncharacterized protein LOC118647872 n=1 Tax=Monomorium pharaonis TaxID=307658 RepID=UPI00063F3617|nr:uncharacterized protein LOC118647872 [Monomorium pharaonis]
MERKEVNCSQSNRRSPSLFCRRTDQSVYPQPTMVSPLGQPGKTRQQQQQQQSRAIRASVMASTSRRNGAGGSKSAGAAGIRRRAEASCPTRSVNGEDRNG